MLCPASRMKMNHTRLVRGQIAQCGHLGRVGERGRGGGLVGVLPKKESNSGCKWVWIGSEWAVVNEGELYDGCVSK